MKPEKYEVFKLDRVDALRVLERYGESLPFKGKGVVQRVCFPIYPEHVRAEVTVTIELSQAGQSQSDKVRTLDIDFVFTPLTSVRLALENTSDEAARFEIEKVENGLSVTGRCLSLDFSIFSEAVFVENTKLRTGQKPIGSAL